MKILVTGSKGFIGKNLVAELKNRKYEDIFEYDIDTPKEDLEKYTRECDFVYHLAGVNRPESEDEFIKGNYDFTSELLSLLKKNKSKSPILVTSSVQAEMSNPYGISKKAGEELVHEYGEINNVDTYVYRLTNVFGKWSKPNYNTVVATFCYNIARGLSIKVDNVDYELKLIYVDDVVNQFIDILEQKKNPQKKIYYISNTYNVKLGDLAEMIKGFRESRNTLQIPNMGNDFEKKLYSTYLSFLPEKEFSYPLKMNIDERGSFTEILKTVDRGQVSINISKPGIIKGNHWHHTKNEKFLVVSGKGLVRFRNLQSEKIIEYYVDGGKLEVIDIPVGYSHSIKNIGDTDLVVLIWANELFNPKKSDTYYMEV